MIAGYLNDSRSRRRRAAVYTRHARRRRSASLRLAAPGDAATHLPSPSWIYRRIRRDYPEVAINISSAYSQLLNVSATASLGNGSSSTATTVPGGKERGGGTVGGTSLGSTAEQQGEEYLAAIVYDATEFNITNLSPFQEYSIEVGLLAS